MKVELVTKTKGVGKYKGLSCEEIVAAIARHGKIKEDNGKLVKYLMDNKHWSPLDMINFCFEIETSRAIGRQIIRHSSIRPQEHSQRYSSKIEFEPFELRREHKTNRQSSTDVFNPVILSPFYKQFGHREPAKALTHVKNALKQIQELYDALIRAGVAKECARFLLPEAFKTTISLNGSLRSWLSFLNVRCDHHAQKECQEIAHEIGKCLAAEMPNVFDAIDWQNGLFM